MIGLDDSGFQLQRFTKLTFLSQIKTEYKLN